MLNGSREHAANWLGDGSSAGAFGRMQNVARSLNLEKQTLRDHARDFGRRGISGFGNCSASRRQRARDGALDLVLVGVDAVSRAALDPFKAARDASPATRFAIMSASDTRADILAGLAAGFHGFISKHQSEAEILAAIDDILSGRIYVLNRSDFSGGYFG